MSERVERDNSLQYENLGTVMDYIYKEYKKWEEKYIIPEEEEFNVKLLLQLRFDILTTKPEHTKTKFDLIEMAGRIQSRLRLKEKPKRDFSVSIIDEAITSWNIDKIDN